MKEETLIGISTIPCHPYGTIYVLTLKKSDNIYCDFYKVSGKKVFFIEHIDLDSFCYRIGYQMINNKLIIYSYNIIEGKIRQAINHLYKYYDVRTNMSINISIDEALEQLGFGLTEIDKKIYKTKSIQDRKLEEYIQYLESISSNTNIIPLVNSGENKKLHKQNKVYIQKMMHPISRYRFTNYLKELITGSDKNIKINSKIINFNDYYKGKKY